jgi:hypothetical protein
MRSVVIHGHFYQPPREDPWFELVEREASAAPAHDWNQRIEQECYRAVVAARRYAPDGRIADIVNTLGSINFDFGPTLLSWLEREAPRTYAAVLAGDALSVKQNGGHGGAIAMPYHHLILPLASRRDKVTEVRWGIADFRRRFRREPVGFWLPETAVDEDTLDVLASAGIQFTVLAPHQIEGAPPSGLPGRYRTSSGKTIALFTYDGAIANDVSFGDLLKDGQAFAARLLATEGQRKPRSLVAVATDGEVYGHHRRFGEVALAWVLHDLAARSDLRVENFAAVLARSPAEHDVRLVAPSSWSCPHGVERWRSDCACRLAPDPAGRPIHWRAALRGALDWLAGEIHPLFEREAAALLDQPWEAREEYGGREGDPEAQLRAVAHRLRTRSDAARVRAAELLELEWQALAMFTSCGWFFDDVAGIEAQQVLRYAARAIELTGADAPRLEAGLLERLAGAESRTPGVGTGKDLYLSRIKPALPPAVRVAAGDAALQRLGAADATRRGGYAVQQRGKRFSLFRRRTGREERFVVNLDRSGATTLSIDVTPAPDGARHHLGIADLPEYCQGPVMQAMRADLIARRLTKDERARLAAGEAELTPLVGSALLRAVESLRRDRSARAQAAVLDLADLLALDDVQIPFDVQTALASVQQEAGPRAAAVLAAVARRLGFSTNGD